MAERDSWAVQGTGSTRVVDAEDARYATAALLTPGSTAVSARQGIRPGPNTPFKVAATGTPGINVTVQAGQSVMTATRATVASPSYIQTMDAVKTLAILDVPADPSNQRNDLVIATQSDIYYSDGTTQYIVRRVLGTASASPVDPSLAAFPDNILLARVRVAAGVTTIDNAHIDDLRPGWVVALGGLLPVADATARAAITAPYDGQQIYRQDRDWVEVYDGTAWRVQGIAVCASTTDRDAIITSPYTGQFAVTTDTGMLYRRTASGWVNHTQYRVTQILGADAAFVDFQNIPSTLKALRIVWSARSTVAAVTANCQLRVNGNAGLHYFANYSYTQNTTVSNLTENGNSVNLIGLVPGASAQAAAYATGEIVMPGWDNPNTRNQLTYQWRSSFFDTLSNSAYVHGGSLIDISGPYNQITLSPSSGNFKAGTEVTVYGME